MRRLAKIVCVLALLSSSAFAGEMVGQTAVSKEIVDTYVQIFWETTLESHRGGRIADIPNRIANPLYGAFATATDGLHAPRQNEHYRESEMLVRSTLEEYGDEGREALNEQLRETWAEQGSSQRFEEKYGRFMDNY